MPTYEYECKECGHSFEKFQKMSEAPVCKCPKCSGPVVRLPGRGAGIIFKGSGFYATDYRSRSYRQKETDERRSTSEKGGKKDGTRKLEKKPEGGGGRGKKDD
jgi:putative FmdB family regulatory protein